MNKEELSEVVQEVGDNIIDNIIGPIANIENVASDLYMVTIRDFIDREDNVEDVAEEIIENIEKEYGIMMPKMLEMFPIALMVLFILEESDYLEN